MADPFLGEIKVVAFTFAPTGWTLCDGQLLPIFQNQALFALLGTMYGGNGQTTFALPDLRGKIPVHVGGGHVSQGEFYGAPTATLIQTQMPTHLHTVNCNDGAGTAPGPVGEVWAANSKGYLAYKNAGGGGTLAPTAIGNTGGSQPHDNIAPYLCLNFVIALQGIFPARS
jgi:microcystin-dependent protein